MRIQLINPNTCKGMTDKIALCAEHIALPTTRITACSPLHGPETIECARDEVLASSGLLEVIRECEQEESKPDGYIVACFGDPALDAVKELTKAPVIGIAQAAFHTASLVANRFAVVTTLARTIPTAEHLLQRYSLAERCCAIRAIELPVMALEQTDHATFKQLLAACQQTLQHDGAEAIVLGCAGMSDLVSDLQSELGVPVIDGVTAAVSMVESLHRLSLSTSKISTYAPPPTKPFTGRYQHWSNTAGKED
ncbi:aspartate/glutamate racemase family protein [Photobacterium sp. ZSDE20]|uniref:Aspartate/glutamate racemase family protein n=1 Tax=Photobacterium pectinilyticum TaxID=2906793 RepID=A0ABT1NB72_9GAMM|nr:aspartate/glutamate racemase family protein [Photobacterium sp. ZSDE20]MCQ1060941.1 aspartate/glutamate racemase family protein [Photobacterium sp. ZSDE20]MDD1828838.1 aspartate/glutamate racemase family protein [Photobacterium sp. ZSDE20]